MPRYKLILEYNGTPFAGWQRQNDQPSVQGVLEEAIERFCGTYCPVTGAGRTDSGVHASGQVAHVDLPKEYDPFRVLMGINAHLRTLPLAPLNGAPSEGWAVVITRAEPVTDDFHARFSATRRHYLYRILNRRAPAALDALNVWHVPETLDVNAMRQAAKILTGTHDFSSFRDSQCQSKSPIKTLERFDVAQYGEEIQLTLSARSFLHHQVRNLAGSLRLVGNGRWNLKDIEKALTLKDRKAGGPTAPPEGLCLTGVDY